MVSNYQKCYGTGIIVISRIQHLGDFRVFRKIIQNSFEVVQTKNRRAEMSIKFAFVEDAVRKFKVNITNEEFYTIDKK